MSEASERVFLGIAIALMAVLVYACVSMYARGGAPELTAMSMTASRTKAPVQVASVTTPVATNVEIAELGDH